MKPISDRRRVELLQKVRLIGARCVARAVKSGAFTVRQQHDADIEELAAIVVETLEAMGDATRL